MKFLCVECDTPMALTSTSGPDNGSMQVLFKCRSCDREIAMLTNAMETQMVHSLGVKIGPNSANGSEQNEAAPMGTIRSSLRGYTDSEGTTEISEEGSGEKDIQVEHQGVSESSHHGSFIGAKNSEEESASKCPFTAMVGEQMDKQAESAGPLWTPEAEARMAQIPSFIRPMVRKGIEDHARSNKCPVIDDALIDNVRNTMGM